MTHEEAVEILTRKLARRRVLNTPEARSHRFAMTPPPQSISLTFREAEAILQLLQVPAVAALTRLRAQLQQEIVVMEIELNHSQRFPPRNMTGILSVRAFIGRLAALLGASEEPT